MFLFVLEKIVLSSAGPMARGAGFHAGGGGVIFGVIAVVFFFGISIRIYKVGEKFSDFRISELRDMSTQHFGEETFFSSYFIFTIGTFIVL